MKPKYTFRTPLKNGKVIRNEHMYMRLTQYWGTFPQITILIRQVLKTTPVNVPFEVRLTASIACMISYNIYTSTSRHVNIENLKNILKNWNELLK